MYELIWDFILSVCLSLSLSGLAVTRFSTAVGDYNGTRPGDVFVVNFGAHYRDGPESDMKFRNEIFPILEEMARFAEEEDVTMVWR